MTTLTPDELRTLFLFEKLDQEQLEWLAARGVIQQHTGGSFICVEGEPAEWFIVLLSGTMSMSRRSRGDDVEVTRTDQRGVYGGATQAYIEDPKTQVYSMSLRAISDVEVYALPAAEFAGAMREWFPMAMHLLEGLFFGMRQSLTMLGERERLLALGSLSAGLTHELNNPASAAVRATSILRDRIAGMRHKLAMIADGRLDARKLHTLVEFQEDAVKRAQAAPKLSALDATDAEDALTDWLEEHDVAGAYDLAGTLIAGGIDAPWLERVAESADPVDLESAIRWISYTVDTELLIGEIDDSVGRISGLVAAAKQYSQLDRAPHQRVDIHELLDATLVMLNAKIPATVTLVREYDPGLPQIDAYGAELNQVWTNLIDNALAAMAGKGTLTVRTFCEQDRIVVEIGDTGPGIPEDIRPRIFEPFFSTKPVGQGTGLGLDISYRIVVNKHHGDIRVISSPGDTRFQVILPRDGH
jgi:signal transduction histidine kinase